LINSLLDHATISALWGSPYDVAKEEILSLLPKRLQSDVLNIFNDFESIEWETWSDTKWKRAEYLVKINDLIYENSTPSSSIGDNQIAIDDYDNIVKNNICKIGEEYDILLVICGQYNKDNTEIKIESINLDIPPEETKQSTGMPTIVKVLLRILGIVIFVFVWAISAFAIKAKLREKYENEED
jgi:hypothetical protein